VILIFVIFQWEIKVCHAVNAFVLIWLVKFNIFT